MPYLPVSSVIPHLSAAVSLNGDGTFAFVNQDTIEEVEQSVEVICGSVPGERTVVPTFGLPSQVFTNPNPGAIQATILQWENRATTQVTVQYSQQGEASINVAVGLQQRGPVLRQNDN